MYTTWTLSLLNRVAAAVLVVTLCAGMPLPVVAASAETPLTPEQEASIRDEMQALGQILVGGGKTPREAQLAANAVGICLGAAYTHGLTRTQADTVCGKVLDAFIIQQGTTLYELTPDDQALIATRVVDWTDRLGARLASEELDAVRSTMQACLEGYMRRGESPRDAVERCAMGLLPLLNEPELQQLLVNAAGAVR
jgi:hypothetical protein